jgi:hypothetical protein
MNLFVVEGIAVVKTAKGFSLINSRRAGMLLSTCFSGRNMMAEQMHHAKQLFWLMLLLMMASS